MTADPAALANLRGLALPAPVSWWPPQPGWWVLAAALLAFLLLVAARLVRWYRRGAYRRAAVQMLRGLPRGPGLAPSVTAILKRAALAAYPRDAVAGLTGAAWVAFLARTGGFPAAAAAAMERAAIDADQPLDGPEGQRVLTAAQAWLRRHRAETGR